MRFDSAFTERALASRGFSTQNLLPGLFVDPTHFYSFSRFGTSGVHWEREFSFPIFLIGLPLEWEWTLLSKGMGIRIVTREWEGIGMGIRGKIPVSHRTG